MLSIVEPSIAASEVELSESLSRSMHLYYFVKYMSVGRSMLDGSANLFVILL